MIILFTGTPGTGKSTLAKTLAKTLNHTYLDVNKVIDKHNLIESFDKERKTNVVDEKKLSKILEEIIKKEKNLIIDSHLSHFIKAKLVDFCIVTKTDLKTLKKRLEKRKYPKNKIKENLESEIFDICLMEAAENKHNVIVIDTTKGKKAELIKIIKNAISKNKR